MYLHDLALIFLAFISELIGTLSGFGSSTFFVPLALLVEKFEFVLALTAILHCFGNSWRIFLFRKYFQKASFALLMIPAIVFAGIGALLTTQFPTEQIQRVLGFTLIVIALFMLFNQKLTKLLPRWAAVFLSVLSGFFTGFVGTGGVLRGLALSALQLPKNTFIMTSASVDLGGDLLRAIVYIKNGYMQWDHWYYIPLLGIAAYLGTKIGKRLIDKLNQSQFERIVSIFILISGAMMLLK